MIDQLAKEMFANLQTQTESLKEIKAFSEKQLKQAAEAAMKKMNLVTREEFEVQETILLRSREKIEALEKQLRELEAKLQDS